MTQFTATSKNKDPFDAATDPIPALNTPPAPQPATPQPEQVQPSIPTDILNIDGFIEIVTAIPTHTPRHLFDQVKIYLDDPTGPTTKRLYVFNIRSSGWSYTTLT